jgi:precorrin-6Y C5,15-methyltransferase (decarboxylating)
VGEIKAALMNTAAGPMRATNGAAYPESRVGAGRLAVDAAMRTTVIVGGESNPGAVSLSFGSILASSTVTRTQSVRVVNLGTTAASFRVVSSNTLDQPGVRVLPQVSSVTLACARMGWPSHDTEVISLVTAPVHTAVRRGGRAVVLCRDAGTPAALAAVLVETGRGDSEFAVLEQLGGPAERIRTGPAAAWVAAPPADVDDLNVVAVRYLPDENDPAALPDAAFRHDGQITKQTIRAVTLAALSPRRNQLLWDVGSGSGSIAVQWCRAAPGCRAVAFETDPHRQERIEANSRAFGVDVEIRGEAPDSFEGAPRPDVVFIGGGLTVSGLLEECLGRLAGGGLLVANAVTAESEALLVQWYSRLGGELRRFQHYLGEPLGGFTGWRPQMPITQWSVKLL